MSKDSGELEQVLTKVAWLHYVDNLTQQEIADRLELSRPKVGRLLQTALSTGIVEIRLAENVTANVKLSRRLEERLGLKEVIVVESTGDDVLDRRLVGKAAAVYLQRVLKGKFTLGVGIGLTVNEIIPFLHSNHEFSQSTIIGISGGFSYPEISSIEMNVRLSERLGARAESIYAPFILDTASARAVIYKERYVRSQLEKAAKCNIVITGVGAITETNHFFHLGYIDKKNHEFLLKQNAIGEIMARFYDIDGRVIPNDLDLRMIGLDLEQLRSIPTVVGMATNEIKAASVLGGVRSGALNVLIIDDRLARAVIALEKETQSKENSEKNKNPRNK